MMYTGLHHLSYLQVEQMWSGSKVPGLFDRFTLVIPFCLDFIKCKHYCLLLLLISFLYPIYVFTSMCVVSK